MKVRGVLRPGVLSKLTAKGRVVDRQGQAIYRASVTLRTNRGSRRVTTGRNGAFTFATMESGRYKVHVAKAGFTAVNGSLTVPQTKPLTIRMRQSTSSRSQVRVRLMEQVGGEQRPFSGPAKVLIQTGTTGTRRQLASMDGRSEAIFTLPSGNVTVSVTSPAAQRISPTKAEIRLHTSRETPHTLTFTIHTALTISNPDPKVLGFVCRKIPRSPDPQTT
jgi:hypothetical protein